MIKVGIAIPHGGRVSPHLYRNVFKLQNALQTTHEFLYVDIELASVSKARNLMVEACLDAGVDLIHFIDDDVLIPDEATNLYKHNTPIVAGLYMARQFPNTPQMYQCSPNKDTPGMYVPVLDYSPGTLQEVDAVGAGCLLVQAEVFRDLRRKWDARKVAALISADDVANTYAPWAETNWFAHMGMKLSPWFEFLDILGEDFYFCERAREAGYRIFCDTSVRCIHLGELGYSEAHFLDARARGLIQVDESYKVKSKEIDALSVSSTS